MYHGFVVQRSLAFCLSSSQAKPSGLLVNPADSRSVHVKSFCQVSSVGQEVKADESRLIGAHRFIIRFQMTICPMAAPEKLKGCFIFLRESQHNGQLALAPHGGQARLQGEQPYKPWFAAPVLFSEGKVVAICPRGGRRCDFRGPKSAKPERERSLLEPKSSQVFPGLPSKRSTGVTSQLR